MTHAATQAEVEETLDKLDVQKNSRWMSDMVLGEHARTVIPAMAERINKLTEALEQISDIEYDMRVDGRASLYKAQDVADNALADYRGTEE